MTPTILSTAETQAANERPPSRGPSRKKHQMSIKNACLLARRKLSQEAARTDHDLRLLVGHANIVDSLMIDLANAEAAQERPSNRCQAGAQKPEEALGCEAVVTEEHWATEDQQSSREPICTEEDFRSAQLLETACIELKTGFDDDKDNQSLALTRTVSRHCAPDFITYDDSDSEDEYMPPSLPNLPVRNFTAKQSSQINVITLYSMPTDTSLTGSLETDSILYLQNNGQPPSQPAEIGQLSPVCLVLN